MNIRDVVAAQFLMFERPPRARLDNRTGLRMLLAFLLLGIVLHPLLRWLAPQTPEKWTRVFIVGGLLLGVIVVLWMLMGKQANLIGLHAWKDWTSRERIYLWTVIPTAGIVFVLIFQGHLASIRDSRGLVGLLLVSVPVGILWGFVQEVIYRGFLQTELTRRWGGFAGVLVANVLFTFGPLHYSYLRLDSMAPPRWGLLTAIFLIGLFFGTLYRRSENLWLAALLHGLWPPNMS